MQNIFDLKPIQLAFFLLFNKLDGWLCASVRTGSERYVLTSVKCPSIVQVQAAIEYQTCSITIITVIMVSV